MREPRVRHERMVLAGWSVARSCLQSPINIVEENSMASEIERITVQQAREDLKSGAVLVCAYDDDSKCERTGLQGVLSLRDLESRVGSRDREIIFYCA